MHPCEEPSKVVARTRLAFTRNVTKDVNHRLKNLKGFVRFLRENEENIVEAMYEDMRKQSEEARLEVYIALSHVRFLIDNVRKWSRPKRVSKRWVDVLDGLYVHHEPYGVVLIMTAWNVPLLTVLPAAGAIAAGNCVVIKISHNSPKFGKFLANTLPKYLDPICYPVVLGGIEETNLLLTERFDYIYYTGSTTVGRIVHQAANKHLTPTTLELGGKNPVYIDPSADIELAASRIIWGKAFGSGHICLAPDYILCDKSVEEKFVEFAKTIVAKWSADGRLNLPIVNDVHFKRLQDLMVGLNVVVGGQLDVVNNCMAPTIAIDVPREHAIMQEEIFGPILPILTVKDHVEAVEFINQKEKALALYIFTEKSTVSKYIMDNTASGGVTINDTLMQLVVENLPFGGVGNSGMGCYKQKYSFDSFVHKRSVLVKNSNRLVEKLNWLRYPPNTKRKSEITEFLIRYRKGFPWFWAISLIVVVVLLLLAFLVVFT